MSKIDSEQIDEEKDVSKKNNLTENIAKAIDVLSSEESKRFAKNPKGYVLTNVYEQIKRVIGDNILVFAHAITFSNTKITYSYEDLKQNDYSNINEYTKVGKYKKQKIDLSVENKYEDEEYRRFSTESEIPVITMELYNIATDNVEFFDTNFFTIDKDKHPDGENSPWVYLRNIAALAIRISLYICASILIILLIYNGIQIVRHSHDNPISESEVKKRLNSLFLSAAMLIGSVLIMALCIYGGNYLVKILKVEDSTELPIRVNVEEAEYSFSTNITGYFRYMTEIEGIQNYKEKGMYTFIYILIAFVDLGLALFFDIRMFLIIIGAIIGPIIAVRYAANVKNAILYRKWCKAFVKLSFVQIFFVILYKLIYQVIL